MRQQFSTIRVYEPWSSIASESKCQTSSDKNPNVLNVFGSNCSPPSATKSISNPPSWICSFDHSAKSDSGLTPGRNPIPTLLAPANKDSTVFFLPNPNMASLLQNVGVEFLGRGFRRIDGKFGRAINDLADILIDRFKLVVA